jgi:esterase/lipase
MLRTQIRAVATVLLLLVGCASAPLAMHASTALVSEKTFRLKTGDGVELAARAWGSGAAWIVLSSNGDGKSERWQPLVDSLVARGYAVLAYDWRGTNPAVPGASDWTKAVNDAQAALAYARGNGARRLVLVGSSLGGIASIKLGSSADVVGVAVLGAPYGAKPLNITEAELGAIKGPKLFITSKGDTVVPASDVQWLHDRASSPKKLHIYTGSAHGVDLLSSPNRKDVLQRISAFVTSVAPLSPAVAATQTATDSARAARWREDLDYLVNAIRTGHPKAFFKGTEAEFDARVKQLRDDIPVLSDDQIKADLMRLCAMFDGHTRIFFGQTAMGWHLYGLRLYRFSDGLAVVEAQPPNKALVGAKVLRVGGHAIDEVMARISQYVEHDNDAWIQFLAPAYVLLPELLQAAGIINDAARPEFVLQTRDGRQVTVNPPVMSVSDFRAWSNLFALPPRADAMWLSHKGERFWLMPLNGGKAVYIQYNEVRSSNGNESLGAFTTRAHRAISAPGVQRVIVDMRLNGGGDNTTYYPLLSLLRSELVNQPGKLYVLTGRNTFSAAANFTTEVEQTTRAIFAGEPMGGSPNLYGDTRTYTLSNSKIEAWISTRYWQKSKPSDKRVTIEPQIKAALSSADWLAGRDPVLEAVLRAQ